MFALIIALYSLLRLWVKQMNVLSSSRFSLQWKKLTATVLVVTSCSLGIFQLQQANINIGSIRSKSPEDIYEKREQQAALNLHFLDHVPSFGFDTLLADWIFLRFIQYQGNREAREVTGYSLNPEYFQAVVERDPRFLSAYFMLSPATTLFAGSPDESVQLLEQGIEAVSPEKFPRAYFLWLYKGVDEMLFLGDIPAAIHSYEMAAQWASLQDNPEAQRRANKARKTAQFLKENPLSPEARVSAWGSILSRATDQATRELAIEKIRALGGEVTVTSEGRVQIQLPESSQ
jgi:hypothetical protein